MAEFDALYYDGRTSSRHPVRVHTLADCLRFNVADEGIEVPLAEIVTPPPVPGTRRILSLPGGAQLQTDDHAAVEALFPERNRLEGWVHGLEARWRYALAALAVCAGFSWWAVVHGLPAAAKLAANAVPMRFEREIAQQALLSIDKSFCDASTLGAPRQQELRNAFGILTDGLHDGNIYTIEFRACRGLGANAFALPGGTMVMTDALVKLAKSDQELQAVMAHEIGHVRHRHGTRLAFQAAGLAALISALTGDAASTTSLVVALPTALLQSGYSRELEEEADDYAFERLREIGVPARYFAEIMARLEESHSPGAKKGEAGKEGKLTDYLSTHPATGRRIERAMGGAR